MKRNAHIIEIGPAEIRRKFGTQNKNVCGCIH
jgi:hypothetical protein